MSSPSMGAWTCRHNVDGRDHCGQCHGPADNEAELSDPQNLRLRSPGGRTGQPRHSPADPAAPETAP